MHPFRKLIVWQRAHQLALDSFKASKGIANREFPGLASQLRRAATSIPTNIVEGSAHSTPGQFERFLTIALASAHELDYHLLLAIDLGALPRPVAEALQSDTWEVKRMLIALMRRVRVPSSK